MREISFYSILKTCVRAAGWDMNSPAVADKLPIFAELITDKIKYAIEYEFWTDTMRHHGFSFISNRLRKGDYWDETALGKTEQRACVFLDEPILPDLPGALDLVGEYNGYLTCNDSRMPEDGTEIYVRYQIVPPQFSSEEYDSTATYNQGDVVFGGAGSGATNNHCYMSRTDPNTGNALSSGTNWKKQAFPEFFREYVKWAVAAEFVSEESGMAARTKNRADAWLENKQISVLQGSGAGNKAQRRAQ